jgi:transcriptional regulator with XRE-family HTH domain
MATPVGVRILRAFGKVLRECRENAGLSQQELADTAGRNRKFISSLENGHQEPGLGTQWKLARAIGISVGEMLTRTEGLVLPLPVRERMARDTEAKVPLGSETCPSCKAVYALYARRLKARERGKFKCQYCAQQLATWLGTTTFIYETRRLPKSQRAK